MAIEQVQARLLDSCEIAPEVRHFVFETPGINLVYRAGQFLMLYASIQGRRVRRAYSLASAPRPGRFELCLNRVREGIFSPYLFDLKPGARVEFRGPYGAFGWRPEPAESLLIATGTGVAPFRAMLEERRDRPATLLFGVRHEYGILYREEFARRAGPGFRFWPTLTRPGPSWSGRTGRVQQHVEAALGGRGDVDVYICGLWEMVVEVRRMLAGLGIDRKRVVYERYD
ncbi:MAG: ferredoxin--NADP reductase [Bryobacteraceae bacterium]